MQFQPTLVPAYGRDYKSKKAVIDALNSGEDFRCEPHGSYINLEGLTIAKFTNISVRYKKLAQCIIVNVIDGKVKDGYR